MKKTSYLVLVILFYTTIFAQQFSLDFDGVNDYVQVNDHASLRPGSGSWTIALWAKLPDVSKEQIFIEKVDRLSGNWEQYALWVGGDDSSNPKPGKRIIFNYIEDGGTIARNCYTNDNIIDGDWHYIVGVANHNTQSLKIFVDGIEKTITTNHHGSWPEINNTDPVYLGCDNPPTGQWYTDGLVDEISLWSTALTQSEIQEWMNRTITDSHPEWANLEAYWTFDDNSDPTTDYSDNNNSGNLLPNSSEPDFYSENSPVGDYFIREAGTSNLTETFDVPVDITWDGDNPGTNAVFSAITFDEEPNIITGLLSYHAPTYWEIWIANDDGSFNADVDFHFDNIPGINDENYLRLYTRQNALQGWSIVADYTIFAEGNNSDGVGYIRANDLSSFSQFIISSDENPLPVVLSSFTAIQTQADFAQINWTTQSENDISGYNIYRNTIDQNETAIKINNELILGTNTSNEQNYSYLDEAVEVAEYFYWLESVELSGNTELFGPIEINIEFQPDNPTPPSNIITGLHQNYPNPFNPETEIQFALDQPGNAELVIYNLKGQKVITLFNDQVNAKEYINVKWNGSDNSGNKVSSGIYMYKLKTANKEFMKKMILMK